MKKVREPLVQSLVKTAIDFQQLVANKLPAFLYERKPALRTTCSCCKKFVRGYRSTKVLSFHTFHDAILRRNIILSITLQMYTCHKHWHTILTLSMHRIETVPASALNISLIISQKNLLTRRGTYLFLSKQNIGYNGNMYKGTQVIFLYGIQ